MSAESSFYSGDRDDSPGDDLWLRIVVSAEMLGNSAITKLWEERLIDYSTVQYVQSITNVRSDIALVVEIIDTRATAVTIA